jgi:hypothetical protein
MSDLLRYYHTVKHLKTKQAFHQVLRRIRPVNRISKKELVVRNEKQGYDLHFTEFIKKIRCLTGDKTFRFLNIEDEFPGWNDLRNGMLWNYNLNYMDYILQDNISFQEGLKWIDKFIQDVSQVKYGMEPYPLSLRGINWIKFLSANRSHIPGSQLGLIDGSLYAQYRILAAGPEYHIMGNHLLKNGLSLLFGAFYFHDKQLYLKAKIILERELDEQVLEDGAHFELSPMYHQVILEYLLDCINLTGNNNNVFPDQDRLFLKMRSKAEKMIGWLSEMTLPDGNIPLFNDSAEGIAPVTEQLVKYASRLGIEGSLTLLSDSGYRCFRGINYCCIADAGMIGPGYIPGHGHADTFTFVLSIGSQQHIVDTGISTYEKNGSRQRERGTDSHNTVFLNGLNSSDVWNGFRVGRRASVKIIRDDECELVAEHDGYRAIGATHRRRFVFRDYSITVEDTIPDGQPGRLNLHFHPEVKISLEGTILKAGLLRIHLKGFERSSLASFSYHPQFNISIPSIRFEGSFTGSCEMKLITG